MFWQGLHARCQRLFTTRVGRVYTLWSRKGQYHVQKFTSGLWSFGIAMLRRKIWQTQACGTDHRSKLHRAARGETTIARHEFVSRETLTVTGQWIWISWIPICQTLLCVRLARWVSRGFLFTVCSHFWWLVHDTEFNIVITIHILLWFWLI